MVFKKESTEVYWNLKKRNIGYVFLNCWLFISWKFRQTDPPWTDLTPWAHHLHQRYCSSPRAWKPSSVGSIQVRKVFFCISEIKSQKILKNVVILMRTYQWQWQISSFLIEILDVNAIWVTQLTFSITLRRDRGFTPGSASSCCCSQPQWCALN